MSRMGLEIGRLRKEVGMTQKQLAKLVGVAENFIIDVETGKRVVSSDLAARISKALRKEVGSLEIYEVEEVVRKPEPDKNVVKVIEKPVQAIWTDALSGVLKEVSVYDGKMQKVLGTRKLAVLANQVEGLPKDRVLYLAIEDNDMIGFRIAQGDVVLSYSTQEIEKDAILLLEIQGKRMIRQVRVLEGNQLLLVGNDGRLTTETVARKDVRVLARLVRVEIRL